MDMTYGFTEAQVAWTAMPQGAHPYMLRLKVQRVSQIRWKQRTSRKHARCVDGRRKGNRGHT